MLRLKAVNDLQSRTKGGQLIQIRWEETRLAHEPKLRLWRVTGSN